MRSTPSTSEKSKIQDASDEPRLGGGLKTVSLVFTALAYNAPLAVVIGQLPVIISFGNGVGAPVLLLFAGSVIGLFAVGFTTMSRKLAKPGGFYAFITAGLGRVIGLGASFVAVVSYYIMLLGCYAFGGIALNSLVADTFHGPDIAWWIWVLVLLLVTGVLGHFRLDLSAKVLTFLLVCELIVVAVYDAFVVFQGGAQGLGFQSFTPDAIFSGSLGVGLLFCFTMFGGFESTVIFRDEVSKPDRTIPRATYLIVGFVTLAYSFGLWVFINAYGPSQVVAASADDPTASSLSSIKTYVGQVAVDATTILLATSIFAAVLSTHNISSRYLYNLGADRILPRSLSRVHRRHGSPYRASFAIAVLSFIGILPMVIFDADAATLYARLLGAYGYTLIILLLLTSVAVLVYFRKKKMAGISRWKTVYAPGLAFVGLSLAAFLATQNFDQLVVGSSTLAAAALISIYGLGTVGAVVALLFRRHRPDTYARIGRQ